MDDYISIKYKSMNQIDDAKKFMPNLPIPEYIPEGHRLKSLTIDKTNSNEYSASYIYENIKSLETSFIINIFDLGDSKSEFIIDTPGEVIELDDRKLLLMTDHLTDENGIEILIDNLNIGVVGNISKEEKLKISKFLRL